MVQYLILFGKNTGVSFLNVHNPLVKDHLDSTLIIWFISQNF